MISMQAFSFWLLWLIFNVVSVVMLSLVLMLMAEKNYQLLLQMKGVKKTMLPVAIIYRFYRMV